MLNDTANASLTGNVTLADIDAKVGSIGVYIGSSGSRTKCVSANGLYCPPNAGNRGIRLNSDHRNAGDTFSVTMSNGR
eukprot:13079838-Alexandrium_andersonii.AAC.1